ncbi:MAG TPA: S-adenosylmethionine:tRNA ribosyltransferase-isomerase, partial [Verrucomicrobiae bacterium]
MRTSDFQFPLPSDLIAQRPAPRRDQSRLMVVRRQEGTFDHQSFIDLPDFLLAGDVLVLNNSRVIPARLRGVNVRHGGEFELLLLEEGGAGANDWWAMVRPGKRARLNTQLVLKNRRGESTGVIATVIGQNPEGHRRLRFSGTNNIRVLLDSIGEVPLPPYIRRTRVERLDEDARRYQTVYAQADAAGSVAAPTAGLHFTGPLLEKIRALGVQTCFVTLHVGLGTFAPVKAQTLDRHVMHEERYRVSPETAQVV